jgi:hypothetical protein
MLKIVAASAMAVTLTGCALLPTQAPTLSTLVDLDPASTERTFIVEGLATDQAGRLYTPDRVSGNVLRIDPRDPKPVVVGRIPERTINGRATAANGGSLVFDAQGNLLIAAAGFGEVVRLRASDLDPARPGTAQTFATGVPGANGITLDRQGRIYVSGGVSGTSRAPCPTGARSSRSLPTAWRSTLPACCTWPTRRAGRYGVWPSMPMARRSVPCNGCRTPRSTAPTASTSTIAAGSGSRPTS